MSEDAVVKKQKTSKWVKPIRERNGQVSGYEFLPSSQMRAWVMLRTDKRNVGRHDVDILKEVGWPKTIVNEWADKHGDLFLEWLEDALHASYAPIREILHQVGIERASAGDFPFWKELARTHGVISAEVVDIDLSVASLTKGLQNLTQDELEKRRAALLAKTFALGTDGTNDLAGAPDVGGQGSTGYGNGNLQDGPVALDDASSSNGERPLGDAALSAVPRQAPPLLPS